MQTADRNAIEHFVRVTLGCRCPDDVFQSITLEPVGDQGAGAAPFRLIIGDRLLIYVLEAKDAGAATGAEASSSLQNLVAGIARAGIAERDALGLNRFRLVIALAGAGRSTNGAASAFDSVAGTDDHAHLHFVEPAQIPPDVRRR